MPKITKRLVDATPPGAGEVLVWDEEVRRFGLRVLPSGGKSYCIQYRNARGRSRRYTIGRHGEWTPEAARIEAKEKLRLVDQGGDPAADKASERARGATDPTVEALAERYVRDHAERKKKPSSIRSDRQLWRNHVLPALGPLLVAEVGRAEVSALHSRIGQTAPGAANRALALLSKAFNLAELWGWRPDHSNPCRHVERFRERRRERFLSGAELARLGEVLREVEADGSAPPAAVLAVRLLALTGCRLGEVLGLQWSEVDFDRSCLALTDSKTGEKTVLLGAPALQLLAKARRAAPQGRLWVVAGAKPGAHLVNLEKPWRRIRRRAGLEDVRLHDLRHSFASVGLAGGASLAIIGKLLGHRTPATTARYAHLGDDPGRLAVDRVSSEIAAALAPAGPVEARTGSP